MDKSQMDAQKLGRHENQQRVPSFRTAFFADPIRRTAESMFFNGLLDTAVRRFGLRRYDGF